MSSFVELVRSHIPQGVPMKTYALRDGAGSAYRAPYATLSSWLHGESSPPSTKLRAAAALIGCSEEAVAMACYGVHSQDAAIRLTKEAQRLRSNAKMREKWRAGLVKKKPVPDEALTERGRRWRKFHRLSPSEKAEALIERRRAAACRRRAKELATGGDLSTADIYNLFKAHGYLCAYCGARRSKQVILTADHIIPLNRGGRNHIANILPACMSCNSSKQDDDLLIWAAKNNLTLHVDTLLAYSRESHATR